MKYPKVRELGEAIKSLVKPAYTTGYPAKPHTPAKNYRGKPVVDDEHCVGCETCANVCPSGVINFTDDKEKKMRIFIVGKLKEQVGIDLNVKLKDLTDIEKEAFKEAVVDATGHADIMTVKGDVLVNTYKAFGGK